MVLRAACWLARFIVQVITSICFFSKATSAWQVRAVRTVRQVRGGSMSPQYDCHANFVRPLRLSVHLNLIQHMRNSNEASLHVLADGLLGKWYHQPHEPWSSSWGTWKCLATWNHPSRSVTVNMSLRTKMEQLAIVLSLAVLLLLWVAYWWALAIMMAIGQWCYTGSQPGL